MKTKQTKTAVGLANGDFFDFANPEKHAYDINAIAHNLSKVCRFGGAIDGDGVYTVAEHSWLISYLVPADIALEGLMHDASEAFTGDMQKPLKEMLPNFKVIEDRIEQAIAKHFDLIFPYPPAIKQADGSLYLTERQQIATACKDKIWHLDKKPASVKIQCFDPWEAKSLFLERFEELSNARNQQLRGEATSGRQAA